MSTRAAEFPAAADFSVRTMKGWKTQLLIRAALSALLLSATFDPSDRRALAAQSERPRAAADDQMPQEPQQAQSGEERRKPAPDEQSALDRAATTA
jgi:hypothetical protein